MTLTTVVFDIGNVLIDWQPHLAWADELDRAEAEAFMERVEFQKLNFACDGGAQFADAATLVDDPQDAARLAQYVERYTLTVPDKITGTWDILFALKERGITLHAITNWSAETWPEGLKVHPELGEVFETTIVSGQVGLVKPSVEIYRLLCDQAEVNPESCVFIDDSLHNCLGAKAAGMDAIHFKSAAGLKDALTQRGLL